MTLNPDLIYLMKKFKATQLQPAEQRVGRGGEGAPGKQIKVIYHNHVHISNRELGRWGDSELKRGRDETNEGHKKEL